jgi:putative membrane protein
MIAANIVIGIVIALHCYFLVLEMFLWTKPFGLKAFGNSKEFAESTKVLAPNQGLYNGFLAAGLIWALFNPDPYSAFHTKLFFLSCIIVAGAYGAISVSKKILFFQALPALLALVLTWIYFT